MAAKKDAINYGLYITANEDNISIRASLPETFEFMSDSDYDTPFSSGIISNARLKLITRLTTGSAGATQNMSMQVWQGTNPINLSFPLVFTAESDTDKDVITPIKQLTKLTMPSSVGGVLFSPGPRFKKKDTLDKNAALLDILSYVELTNLISLQIGNFMYFPSVVITSVSQQYDVRLDGRGRPIKATVSVGFRTFFTPTQDDVEKMYL